jgi:hypothetical protein
LPERRAAETPLPIRGTRILLKFQWLTSAYFGSPLLYGILKYKAVGYIRNQVKGTDQQNYGKIIPVFLYAEKEGRYQEEIIRIE